MSTPERIEELNAKSEKCPHGLYGVCYFCDEHAKKARICGWGALAWIIASLLALCAFAVVSCNAADFKDSWEFRNWLSKQPKTTNANPIHTTNVWWMIYNDGAHTWGWRTLNSAKVLISSEIVPNAAIQSLLTPKFYDALAIVESGNRNVTGDHGRSAGPYQFTAKAWEQANRLRAAAMLPIGAVKPLPYRMAKDSRMARLMAEYYCPWLEQGLTRTLRRKPTVGEIYCAYNLGPSGFRQFGNKIKLCPRTTRDAAAKMERLMR